MGSTPLDFDLPFPERDALGFLLGAIVIGIVVSAFAAYAWPALGCVGNRKREAQTDAATLRTLVEWWRIDHADRASECPSVAVLKETGALRADQDMDDPWGRSYAVYCFGDEVSVLSFGPDVGRPDGYIWAGPPLL